MFLESKFVDNNKLWQRLCYVVARKAREKESAVRNVSVPLELSIYIGSIALPTMGRSSFQLEKLKFSK